MHEILHTYRFWVFDEKTPSLLFMLREEYPSFVKKFSEAILRRWRLCLLVTTIFTLSNHTSEDQYCVPFLCHMQHDVWCLCYAKWCDDVMLRRWHLFRKIHTSPHNIFISALILRCKLCIPLGTSLELLRLLLRRYQRWLFAVSLP